MTWKGEPLQSERARGQARQLVTVIEKVLKAGLVEPEALAMAIITSWPEDVRDHRLDDLFRMVAKLAMFKLQQLDAEERTAGASLVAAA